MKKREERDTKGGSEGKEAKRVRKVEGRACKGGRNKGRKEG